MTKIGRFSTKAEKLLCKNTDDILDGCYISLAGTRRGYDADVLWGASTCPLAIRRRRGSMTLSGQTFGSKQETRGNTVHLNLCPRVNGDGGDMIRKLSKKCVLRLVLVLVLGGTFCI